MSILIKGMEMPSRCNMCQLRDLCYDYYICRAKKLNDGRYLDVDDVKYKRHIKCPLVEIPTPHGRLIDADELFCKIDGIKGWDYGDESDMAISAAEALSAIDDSPTVIEAEVSDK